MTTLPDNATIIVVDVQRAFDHPTWGKRNNPSAEANIGRLLAGWRDKERRSSIFSIATLSRDDFSRLANPASRSSRKRGHWRANRFSGRQ